MRIIAHTHTPTNQRLYNGNEISIACNSDATERIGNYKCSGNWIALEGTYQGWYVMRVVKCSHVGNDLEKGFVSRPFHDV